MNKLFDIATGTVVVYVVVAAIIGMIAESRINLVKTGTLTEASANPQE